MTHIAHPLQKKLLEIESILYHGIQGGKTEKDANKIIRCIQFAHEGKLEQVPEKLRWFAQHMKHHWPELQVLKLKDRKKLIQQQVHGLLNALK